MVLNLLLVFIRIQVKQLIDEWLNYADKDLKTAELLLKDSELTNNVAFHCHQCIEKSFKALIIMKVNEIPKIHNLIKLYGTVRNFLKIDINMETFTMINETYTDARYPSDLGLLPDGLPSYEDVLEFTREARKIFEKIKQETVVSD